MSAAPINDGGPAFPQINQWDNDSFRMGPSGMTLRDYFAAKAAQGLLSGPPAALGDMELVTFCYEVADGMIKARSA